jgi:integrase
MKDERNIKRICEIFKKRFGFKFLHEITSSMILQFKKERMGKAADNTINNELNYLSGVFTTAIEWDKAILNPVRRVKRFRGVERKRILERWEQNALITAAANETMPPHLLPLIVFDLNTGLRKGELLTLKWSDVNYESIQILIRAENAKSNRSRYIDLNRHALAVLKSLPRRSEYVFCDRYGRPFKNFHHSYVSAATLAGLDDLCIHDLRRTFGSNCVMDGVSLPTVQAWMGHRDISTTIKHYSHLVSAFKKEEIKKIEGRMDTCMDTALFY